MFTKYIKIAREEIEGKECITWRSYVEDVNTDTIVALVIPTGLMMLEGLSTIPKERAAGPMIDMSRWARRNPKGGTA